MLNAEGKGDMRLSIRLRFSACPMTQQLSMQALRLLLNLRQFAIHGHLQLQSPSQISPVSLHNRRLNHQDEGTTQLLSVGDSSLKISSEQQEKLSEQRAVASPRRPPRPKGDRPSSRLRPYLPRRPSWSWRYCFRSCSLVYVFMNLCFYFAFCKCKGQFLLKLKLNIFCRLPGIPVPARFKICNDFDFILLQRISKGAVGYHGDRCPKCLKFTTNYARHVKECYCCPHCHRYFTDRLHTNRCLDLQARQLANMDKMWTCEICGCLVERRLRHIREVHKMNKSHFRLVVPRGMPDGPEKEELRKVCRENRLRVSG